MNRLILVNAFKEDAKSNNFSSYTKVIVTAVGKIHISCSVTGHFYVYLYLVA